MVPYHTDVHKRFGTNRNRHALSSPWSNPLTVAVALEPYVVGNCDPDLFLFQMQIFAHKLNPPINRPTLRPLIR